MWSRCMTRMKISVILDYPTQNIISRSTTPHTGSPAYSLNTGSACCPPRSLSTSTNPDETHWWICSIGRVLAWLAGTGRRAYRNWTPRTSTPICKRGIMGKSWSIVHLLEPVGTSVKDTQPVQHPPIAEAANSYPSYTSLRTQQLTTTW